MYPSINNNGYISFTSINVQPMKMSSLYNYNNDAINLSKPPREHSSSSFHLLSPHYNITLEDETILSDLLLQQENPFEFSHYHHHHHNHDDHNNNTNILFHQQSAMEKCSNNNNGTFVAKKDGDCDNINDIGFNFNIHSDPKSSSTTTTTRRRSSNKDRHSKINTARGPRDRRMRLSIDVAKKFFKLQDMLGFDKASKTVEWLLMKSNSEELLPTHHKLNMIRSSCMTVSNNNSTTASSTSNCEVLADSSSNCNIKEKIKKGSIGRNVRKSAYFLHSPLAKETRDKARARARERTLEKSSKNIQCSKSTPFLDQVFMDDQYLVPSMIIDQHAQQISSGDNSSLMIENWSPSLFNYQHGGELLHEVMNVSSDHPLIESETCNISVSRLLPSC